MAIRRILAGNEDKTLYERLGGVFAIAAVVNDFSDAILKNPVVGTKSKNEALRKWSNDQLDRLPGLKWMRTLWVCDATGGPYEYHATVPGSNKMDLSAAHRKFHITSEEFDAVADVLSKTLDKFKVPKKEKDEVLAAFAAHKKEVTGSAS
jgi:hemoglobin